VPNEAAPTRSLSLCEPKLRRVFAQRNFRECLNKVFESPGGLEDLAGGIRFQIGWGALAGLQDKALSLQPAGLSVLV